MLQLILNGQIQREDRLFRTRIFFVCSIIRLTVFLLSMLITADFFSEAFELFNYDIEELFTAIYLLSNQLFVQDDERLIMLKEIGLKYINDIEGKRFSNMLS